MMKRDKMSQNKTKYNVNWLNFAFLVNCLPSKSIQLNTFMYEYTTYYDTHFFNKNQACFQGEGGGGVISFLAK